jgi:hypothetical protein
MEAQAADVAAAEVEAAEAAAAELAAEAEADIAAPGTAGGTAAEAVAVDTADEADAETGRRGGAPGAAGQSDPASRPGSASEPRRPTKFMADLTAAMRAAAEAARESTVGQLRVEATTEIEAIRTESTLYTATCRERAEEDVAGVRAWSKVEIARIRAETEEGIAARRRRLDQELVDQAARLEEAIARVQHTVAGFEQLMTQFFERLLQEEDPSRFATMAGQLPDPPAFEPWSPEPRSASDRTSATEPTAMSPADAAAAEGEPAAASITDGRAAAVDGTSDAAPRHLKPGRGTDHELTQVIVVGLVSVASIATFKRMIGRTPGVKSVHVSSGPESEFIFGVTHDRSVDLSATITGMTGFSPTVVTVRTGEISVAARDPEQAA